MMRKIGRDLEKKDFHAWKDKAHLMSFELIPIGPLNPLRQLQGMKANP